MSQAPVYSCGLVITINSTNLCMFLLIMTPALYIVIGLACGIAFAAVVILLSRRNRNADEVLLTKIALLEGAQERGERMIRDEMSRGREENATASKAQREELSKSLEGVRSIVDQRLRELQADNSKQIDKMRETVDEKLQGTLEKRLGESFKLVSDRLEQVHQGLGAMRQLASDVGGLQKVLANVKTRGGWGEVQLGALLEQVLTSDQFSRNVKVRPDTAEFVDFAIRLPGDENGAPVWLPIDAKFPTEDYQRLIAAQEQGNVPMIEEAAKSLETQIKKSTFGPIEWLEIITSSKPVPLCTEAWPPDLVRLPVRTRFSVTISISIRKKDLAGTSESNNDFGIIG